MITRRFDFIHSPLQLSAGLSPVGSVSNVQTYCADTGEYLPDYTIAASYLTIRPTVGIIDKDGILPSGSVVASLVNVQWFETINGTRRQITTSDTAYELTGEGHGDDTGKLVVKKNAEPRKPITLEFRAVYPDPRTGQALSIIRTISIRCRNATEAAPVLTLDAAEQTIYNPVRDTDLQTIRATLRVGKIEVPAKNREFVWEIQRAGGTWSAVGASRLDYCVTVSADKTSVTVDRTLIGERLDLRCRAKYSNAGTPSAVTLNDAAPRRNMAIIRRIPLYHYDITEVAYNIPGGTVEIHPRAVVTDNVGVIASPAQIFDIVWSVARNKAAGTLSYKEVARGEAPDIPTSDFDKELGAVVGLDVRDAGPYKALTLADGSILTLADGSVLVARTKS